MLALVANLLRTQILALAFDSSKQQRSTREKLAFRHEISESTLMHFCQPHCFCVCVGGAHDMAIGRVDFWRLS